MSLTLPSEVFRIFISLDTNLLLNPFFARKDECGLIIRDEFSVNLQNSSFLTRVCNLLILQPVAKSRRKAVFLKDCTIEVVSRFFRYVRTLLKFQGGLDDGSLGLSNFLALNIDCTACTLRSMLK